MNIGINGIENIFKEVIKYDDNSIVKNVNESSNSFNNISDKEQVDTLNISQECFFAYDLVNRFRETTVNTSEVKLSKEFLIDENDYDASFIKNFSMEYYNIKQELSSTYSKGELNEMMNTVDKVYQDVVDKAAESLSASFENFFDYSSNMAKVFKMKSDESVFDKEKFKNHLKSLANTALNTVKNADKDISIDSLNNKIEKNLQPLYGDDLSTMSYKDIKILSNLFENLPSLNLFSRRNFDKNSMSEKEKIWSEALKNLDSNLSKNVKAAVIETGSKNIRTFKKIGNHLEMVDNLNQQLEKLNQLLSKLIEQRKRLAKEMEMLSKQKEEKNNDLLKRKLRLVEQMNNLDNNINMMQEQISNIQMSLDSATNNPDGIDSYPVNEEMPEN